MVSNVIHKIHKHNTTHTIMDPTYSVLKCVSTYLNNEKPLMILMLDIADAIHEISSKVVLAYVREDAHILGLNLNAFDHCMWSEAVQGNTNLYSVQALYIAFLKQFNKVLWLYLKYLKSMLREENFTLPYSVVGEKMKAFEKSLRDDISVAVAGVTTYVRNFDGPGVDNEANFRMYDSRCLKVKRMMEMVLEAHMDLDTIAALPSMDLEPYEIYHELTCGGGAGV